MPARGTRRRRGATDAHDEKCAWCKHMRGSDHACTWKPRGPQDQFVSAADVSGACFGHMVASVWDGSAVRQENKDRLKRCLAMSVSENGNGWTDETRAARDARIDSIVTAEALHLNVEAVGSAAVVKYLHKYVFRICCISVSASGSLALRGGCLMC